METLVPSKTFSSARNNSHSSLTPIHPHSAARAQALLRRNLQTTSNSHTTLAKNATSKASPPFRQRPIHHNTNHNIRPQTLQTRPPTRPHHRSRIRNPRSLLPILPPFLPTSRPRILKPRRQHHQNPRRPKMPSRTWNPHRAQGHGRDT